MPAKLTPLEIYKILPQTNCSRCLLPACLAFATAVVLGKKRLSDCPFLDEATIRQLNKSLLDTRAEEPDQAAFIDRLEEKISRLDLHKRAPVIDGHYQDGRLSINSLGKAFHVDGSGKVTSECHIISWVTAPLLSYITHETHTGISGNWISFRELNGGMEWQNLFTSRCEEVLRKLADENPDLLNDLIDLFMGKPIDIFQADIALILHPLPHIPILICYQGADEDLGSELTIFFDECCSTNLHIKSIFTLCSGIVQMFAKIAEHHSCQ